MPEAIGPIAGAVVGGLMSDDQQSSQKREPWEPAQGWLKDLLRTGQGLQKYYEQNPFNPMQQRAYENLFSDLDTFRSGMAPGLFGMVNNIISNPYQAPSGPSLPGPRQYGSGQPMGPHTWTPGVPAGNPQPRSSTPTFAMPKANPHGSLATMIANADTAVTPPGWQALNPFTNGAVPTTDTPAPDTPADPDRKYYFQGQGPLTWAEYQEMQTQFQP